MPYYHESESNRYWEREPELIPDEATIEAVDLELEPTHTEFDILYDTWIHVALGRRRSKERVYDLWRQAQDWCDIYVANLQTLAKRITDESAQVYITRLLTEATNRQATLRKLIPKASERTIHLSEFVERLPEEHDFSEFWARCEVLAHQSQRYLTNHETLRKRRKEFGALRTEIQKFLTVVSKLIGDETNPRRRERLKQLYSRAQELHSQLLAKNGLSPRWQRLTPRFVLGEADAAAARFLRQKWSQTNDNTTPMWNVQDNKFILFRDICLDEDRFDSLEDLSSN